MKKQNIWLLAILVSASGLVAQSRADVLQTPSVTLTEEALTGSYDLQLYFGNSKPFLDAVHLERGSDFKLKGDMHVPDDFDAPLLNLASDERSVRFEVLVPKNLSRPEDMVFLYEGTISPHDTTKFAGHVTLTQVGQATLEQPEYVASFLMFKK